MKCIRAFANQRSKFPGFPNKRLLEFILLPGSDPEIFERGGPEAIKF